MKKSVFNSIIFPFFLLSFYCFYLLFEPEILKSAQLTVTQLVVNEISLFCDQSVSGLSSISGMSGGTSDGYFSCLVFTNNDSGYTLTFNKTEPLCHLTAGCGENQQFNDYPGPTTDPIHFNWVNAKSGEEYWGFEMRSGEDVTSRFRSSSGPSAPCNVSNGVVTPGTCWVRIPTAPSAETVAYRASPTGSGGSSLSFGIRIQAGPNNSLRSGTYTSSVNITAMMN